MMSSGGGGFGRGGRGAEVGAAVGAEVGAAVGAEVGAAVALGAGLLLPPDRVRRAWRFGDGNAGALPSTTTFGADPAFGTAGSVTAAALAGFAPSSSSPPMPATA